MRFLQVILFSLFAFSASATHLLGGALTWKKTTAGQYVFEVRIYRECSQSAALLPSTTNITGPAGTISLQLQSLTPISPSCLGGPAPCGTSPYGAVERGIYISSPVTLQGTPPASGWEFTWQECCRQMSAVNLINPGSTTHNVRSVMYPGGASSSPQWIHDPSLIYAVNHNTNISVVAAPGEIGDSLFYKLVPSLTYNGSAMPVTYASGYSATSPLPSSLTNAANGPVSIDGNTGMISYSISSATDGVYYVCVAVEQWNNGVKRSEVTIDRGVVLGTISGNNKPAAYIDTAAMNMVSQISSIVYKSIVAVGDTLSFDMNASDFDMNPTTFLPQNISFSATGAKMDTSWSAQGTPGGAKVTPIAPQTGYVKSLNNNIRFTWAPQASDANGVPHNFVFTFQDDQCPYPGVTYLTLAVTVQTAVNISADTLQVCAGDSVQLNGFTQSGNYVWSPATGVSNPIIANPKALPTASGYYYLTDPVSNETDSVYVKLTQPGAFSLAFANGKLELTDANGTTNRIWYYNGVPFYYPYDTLTPLGYGDYWVKSAVGPCLLISNIETINVGQSFSTFDPTNGAYNGLNMPLSGSLGTTFQLSQSANVNSVTLVGVEDLYKSGTGYDLNLKIYDANQTEVFNKDITLTPPFFGPLHIPVGYNLQGNTKYTIAVSGDTAITFNLYENVSYPATPNHNGITLTGSYEGAAMQFPSQPSNYLLPLSINTDVQVVSVGENEIPLLQIYPNPAGDYVNITGLIKGEKIELFDLNGRLIKSYIANDENLRIERNSLSSGVYVIKTSKADRHNISKILFE